MPRLRETFAKEYKPSVSHAKNMTIYAERRKKVLALAKGKQAVAMTGANLFYLTDFWGGGAAIVHPDRTVVITSPLEVGRAEELGREVEVVGVKTWADVKREVAKRVRRGGTIVDDDRDLRGLGKFMMKPDLFLEARRVKDVEEVQRIRKASLGLDRIFDALPRIIRPGKSEWQVAAEVIKMATLNELTPSGSDSALSATIIASGENGALPHSELTDRRIRHGDFVVADIFFRYRGYNSDETRTFAVGRASAEMKKHYGYVLEAQEEALGLVVPGTACRAVHNSAVAVLRRHRVDKYLNHSVGHGVGIDIHELPAISRASRATLLRNDIVTDEPGIYFPGKYGIRIEDTVKTDRKPVVLTKSTKELVICG